MQSTLIVFKGATETGSFRRRHQAVLDRGAARQEPLISVSTLALAFARRIALDPVALRAAAGADRARRRGRRASARRAGAGVRACHFLYGHRPAAGAGRVQPRYRCRLFPVRCSVDHDRRSARYCWCRHWQARLAAAGGPVSAWADHRFGGSCLAPGSAASSASVCCSARCGRPASARRWARPRCWPRRVATCRRSRSPWPCSASGRRLPLVLLGLLSRATLMRLRGRLMSAGTSRQGPARRRLHPDRRRHRSPAPTSESRRRWSKPRRNG